MVNVTNTDDIINATEMAKSMGPVRVLVNSAGIGWAQRTVGKDGSYDSAANLDAFKRVIAINLVGSFDCIRIVGTAISQAEPLEHGERGAIVNIASVAAFDGQIGQASYSASKGGVVGMTLPIARDLAAIGIRVNTVAPGLIDTPIYGEGDNSEAFKANLQKGVLFPQRLGFAGRARLDGRRVHHEQLHERRDDPRRRRDPDAPKVDRRPAAVRARVPSDARRHVDRRESRADGEVGQVSEHERSRALGGDRSGRRRHPRRRRAADRIGIGRLGRALDVRADHALPAVRHPLRARHRRRPLDAARSATTPTPSVVWGATATARCRPTRPES